MRQKHSDIPGRKPHLVSGQFAHNAADRRLFVRVEGRLVEVPLDRIAEGVAETTGPLGAPLVRLEDGGFAWDPTQSPSSVSPDGAVNVDRPPVSLGAPGFLPRDISTDEIDLPAETILLEDFHVASDRIMVESLAFHLVSGSGPVRVGVLTKSGVIVSDRLVEAPTRGAIHVMGANTGLPRGAYRAFLWVAEPNRVRRLHGYRLNQGWDSHGPAGAPRFAVSRRATGAFLDGVRWNGLLTPETPEFESLPGERRALMMGWRLMQTETPEP